MEKVGIEINLMNADEALKTLQRIDRTVSDLGRKRTMIKLDDGSLVSVDERIKQIKDRLAALDSAKKMGVITKDEVREAKRLSAELKVISRGLKDGTANAKTFAQQFNSISSKVAHIGSAMQSLGNAMTRLTSPFRRITTGLLMGAGYKALNMFTEGFGGAFERADIMRNYSRSLEAFGFSAEDANNAIEKLNESVLGLPTGLDEIVALQKKFVAASQDIEKSTNLAIAANNSFLASGSDARQKKVAERIISQLAGGAEIANSSWDALQRAMPLVFTTLAKESKMGVSDYMSALKSGKISTDEFIESFSRIGRKGAIADAANVMKQSWAGLTANIQNATRRMGQGIIESLNSVFEQKTGRTLLQTLLGVDANGENLGDGIKHWIDDLSTSVQDWIKANPDRILEFFETLKSIDFKSLLKGMAEGLGWMVRGIEAVARIAGDKNLERLGRLAIKGNIFGWLFSVGGGLLKGLRHPLAGIGTIALRGFGKLGKGGLFGKLAGIFGKKGDITAAETTAKSIPSVADTFKSAFSALSGLIKAAGAVTLVAGTGFIAFKAAKSILKDLKEMVDLVNGGGWDNVGYVASGVIVGIGAFTEIFQAIGTALGPQGLLAVAIASAASFFVAGAFAADMWAIKTGVIQIRDTITELDNVANAITNMKGINTLGEDVKQKFRTTIDAINEIKQMFVGKNGSPMDRGVVEQGLPTFGIGKVGALTNIANAIAQMQRIVEEFNKLAVLSVTDPSQVIADIKEACNLLQGVRAPKGIKGHTEAAADAIYQMRRMVYHINQLASMSVSVDAFKSVVQQIKDALAELKTLDQTLELDIKVVIGDGFQSSVDGVEKKIKGARTTIQKAVDYVTSKTYRGTVSVTLSASVNTAGAIKTISDGAREVARIGRNVPLPKASGGLIYRAKGGSIPWKKRSTDTVPAMLTPGEFVHNKHAVSAFGIDFMRKVNNLDMKGAMNELMHRAGNMANINRGTNITNNNYNNQRVTINNNGASGAGFTFKSASRFVGAF